MSVIRMPSTPPTQEQAGIQRLPPTPPPAFELLEATRPRLTRAHISPTGALPPLIAPSAASTRLALSPDSAHQEELREEPKDDAEFEPTPHLHRTHRTHSGTLPPLLSPPLVCEPPALHHSAARPLPALSAPTTREQTPRLPSGTTPVLHTEVKLPPVMVPNYIVPLTLGYNRAILREERQTRPEYRARLLKNASHYLQDPDQACRWLLELSEIATNYDITNGERMAIIQAMRASKATSPILYRPELRLPWLRLFSGAIQDISPEIRALARNWLMEERASFVSHTTSKTLPVFISAIGAAASNSRLPLPERVFWQRQLAKLWTKFICEQNMEPKIALIKHVGELAKSFDYGCYEPGLTIAEKQLAIDLFSSQRANLLLLAGQSPALRDELTKQMEELLSAPGTPETAHSLAELFLAGLRQVALPRLTQIKPQPSC